jgi:DNA-binding CsgD family transcriptional regulator
LSVQRPVARRLTGREREVAQLLVVGKQSKEIAKILDLSPRTVDGHRARLLEKYEVRSHVELVSKLLGGATPAA